MATWRWGSHRRRPPTSQVKRGGASRIVPFISRGGGGEKRYVLPPERQRSSAGRQADDSPLPPFRGEGGCLNGHAQREFRPRVCVSLADRRRPRSGQAPAWPDLGWLEGRKGGRATVRLVARWRRRLAYLAALLDCAVSEGKLECNSAARASGSRLVYYY